MKENTVGSAVSFTVIALGVHAIFWLPLFLVLLLVVPRFERTFAEFKMQLPFLTEAVLATSRWLNNYWYVLLLAFPFLLALDGAIVFLLRREPRTRALGMLWLLLWLVLPVLAVPVLVVALWLPMIKLVEGLRR